MPLKNQLIINQLAKMKYIIPLLLSVFVCFAFVCFAVMYKMEDIKNEQIIIHKASQYDSLANVLTKSLRTYQFDIKSDSVILYNGDRFVGAAPLNGHSALECLIEDDNY